LTCWFTWLQEPQPYNKNLDTTDKIVQPFSDTDDKACITLVRASGKDFNVTDSAYVRSYVAFFDSSHYETRSTWNITA